MPLITAKHAQTGWADGTWKKGLYPAGQVMGRIKDVPRVRDLIEQMLSQAAEVCRSLVEPV